MKVFYYKDPQNSREIVKELETAAPVVVAEAVAMATAGQATPDAVAAVAAEGTATTITKALAQKEATAGFKKQILLAEYSNGKVKWFIFFI